MLDNKIEPQRRNISNNNIVKNELNQLTTIDNNTKSYINLNQNEFLTNNYVNTSPFRTQENDQPIEKPIFPSQPSQIYVNNSYSREYVNELKVTMIKK